MEPETNTNLSIISIEPSQNLVKRIKYKVHLKSKLNDYQGIS